MAEPVSSTLRRSELGLRDHRTLTNRDSDTARRHITWLLLLAIPLAMIAMHIGGIDAWVTHTSASWNHMWSQARASWVQMHQVYQQLHSHGAGQ